MNKKNHIGGVDDFMSSSSFFDEKNTTAIVLSLISGLSTGIGGLIVAFFGSPKQRTVGFMLGFSSGVMLFVSFFHLLPESVEKIGYANGILWFVICWIGFYYFIKLIPEPDPSRLSLASDGSRLDPKLWTTGIVVVTGISLHNFPEGMAVYLSSLKGWKLGMAISIAIGMHNIPEGMAVACSMFAATKSIWSAVKWSFLSGIVEPIGAIAFGFFFYRYITEYAVYCMLSGVAGIMTLICFKELIPNCIHYTNFKTMILANVTGMIVLFSSSLLMEMYE